MPDYFAPPAPLKNLPIPATGNPSIERALAGLQKSYPADTMGVQATPDWSPSMYNMNVGYVAGSDPRTIHMNPLAAATFPQEAIDRTMSHELEHVRQFSTPQGTAQVNRNMAMPYDQRPHELQADAASDRYMKARKPTAHDSFMPDVEGKMYYELSNSPVVQGLLQSIK